MALIIVVTAFSYDSADDFYNSLYICQYHNYYNNDINYIFATITGSLQYILLNFNCFVLFQILLSCAAFSSVTFVFADKFGKHKAFIFTLVLNILFSFDHYSNILSSKTAALLLTAGFLMALNAIRNKRYSLPFWIGVLEVIFGTFLCFKYFFVGLAFFITFFIGDMIAKRKYKLPFRKFFWYFRPFVLVFVLIVLIGKDAVSVQPRSFCICIIDRIWIIFKTAADKNNKDKYKHKRSEIPEEFSERQLVLSFCNGF